MNNSFKHYLHLLQDCIDALRYDADLSVFGVPLIRSINSGLADALEALQKVCDICEV